MKVSARNVFAGTVAAITTGAVNSEVVLTLAGGAQVVSVVTNGAVANLGLAAGKNAYAIVKASSVIIATDVKADKISARNTLTGKVARIVDGPVSAEVDIEIADGTAVSAVITHGSVKSLGLAVGGTATAIIKASNVILAVD
ncbi:transporter [Geobacter sp. FeAm09]|uniref:TOBE domain-containing protein n=1 Tax=Geobacter sp. FeAm09 TaxID=2597769 RepID=UPI0011ECA5E2|nr:TOBE domain-containing protein [Geobacter sp. FeAm09]QEM67453.1 transporter [Geobacter sp. FeAm09]